MWWESANARILPVLIIELVWCIEAWWCLWVIELIGDVKTLILPVLILILPVLVVLSITIVVIIGISPVVILLTIAISVAVISVSVAVISSLRIGKNNLFEEIYFKI